MDYRKLVLPIFAAMLGASFMHQASAQWGTGGATKIPRKAHLSGFDLFCDMSRVSFGGYTIPAADRTKIVTLPSALNPGAAPSLTFSGEMFCAEVLPGQSGLENAQNGLVGRFKLIQQSPAQRPTSTLTQTETGLVYSGPDASGVRTWTFKVPAVQTFPFPELLYELVPADDATAVKFCHSGANDCKALLGLQLPATESDYPARDLDGGGNDLALGEVFKFTTKTTGGVEAAGKFIWGPCHSQAFGKPQTFVVDALANASHDGGVGVATGISLTYGQRFAVTVNQNDLWNSGAQPRWSNADGQIREMIATGHDDSQTLAGVDAGEIMGTNWPTKLAGDATHMLHKWDGSSWVVASEAAFGTLVGSTDGVNFYILGTAFDGPAPAAGPLMLYYWDTPRGDNSQFVTVTVAEESIQCTAIVPGEPDPVPLFAQGNTIGFRPVQVGFEPLLNVGNKLNIALFWSAVFGSADLAIAPNGSPIIDPNGTTVRVNGQPVALKAFYVSKYFWNHDGIPDLKLVLKQLDVIKALTPGGTCTDGPVVARLEVGSDANGWFAGEATIRLWNCKRL